MLFPVLLAVGFQLVSNGLGSQTGTFNFRAFCTGQHSSNKYKVSCDGNKHFKNKEIVLDSRSALGITDVELYSFEDVKIISQKSTDWEKVKTITIRNCKKVTFSFQSTLRLNELRIDSVDELVLKTEQSDNSIETRVILLSNVGKLHLSFSNTGEIKASQLALSNIKDVNVYGKLKLSGEILNISQSNIDLTEHSILSLQYASIAVKESTKLYIQESGQLNVSTNEFLIQDSYIYMDGQMNITGYELLGNKTVIKFLKNSIYGMKKSQVHIFGDRNEIDLIENGIYNCDINDVMDLAGETEGVNFTKNLFGCDQCGKKQLLQANYQQHLWEQNFCDLACNLTLARYKVLFDHRIICNEDEHSVDAETLCSGNIEPLNVKSGPEYFWWVLLPVILTCIVCLSILVYFYSKRHLARFRAMRVESSIELPAELQNSQENQKVIVRSFNNDIYDRIENDPDNIYEIVDSNTLRR